MLGAGRFLRSTGRFLRAVQRFSGGGFPEAFQPVAAEVEGA